MHMNICKIYNNQYVYTMKLLSNKNQHAIKQKPNLSWVHLELLHPRLNKKYQNNLQFNLVNAT